ncbi:hypothetical protein RKZ03_00225, partial [Streptococcus pneumoniae]|nr:hypothetical protein [Streptococcus pneumoniae]MDS2942442.1 hypothetical protein [Streptococcus pneumoniae]
LQKTDFYRPEYQKRKDKICPFSSLAFFQPTTVDKEPEFCTDPKKLDFFCLTFWGAVHSTPTIMRFYHFEIYC